MSEQSIESIFIMIEKEEKKKNKLELIKKHKDKIISSMEKNDFSNEEIRSKICLNAINLLLTDIPKDSLDKKHLEQIKSILPQINLYVTEKNYLFSKEEISSIFRRLFFYFSEQKNYAEGLSFYKKYLSLSPISKFNNAFGFYLFFSYQLRSYNQKEFNDILNNFIFEIDINSQETSNDYSLFSFYKGLIHLSKREFIMAAFSFCFCITNLSHRIGIVIDYFQLESIKKLIILSFFIDKEFENIIINILQSLSFILSSERMIFYLNFFNLLLNKNNKETLQKLEKICENQENIKYLKSEKNFGLVKIAIWELRFKRIMEVLGKYNKITMKKLMALSGVEKDNIIKSLQWKSFYGNVNVSYDDVDDIVSVNKLRVGESDLNEMKKYNDYLIGAAKNLYLFDMNKINEEDKIKNMTEEERKKFFNDKKEEAENEAEFGGINEEDMDMDVDMEIPFEH